MSCLKLHLPPVALSIYPPSRSEWGTTVEEPLERDDAGDGPVILKFPGRDRAIAGRIGPTDACLAEQPLARARLLHQNRCCPVCNRAAVVPVDDQPAVAYRNSLAVPGMGRLVGFECDSCGHSWDVSSAESR
ncbi:MAG: hypothetical protein JSS02_29220 [Planctomycetes bacterium]|nr:hypothetical protein [Planctomycetota bacterium]